MVLVRSIHRTALQRTLFTILCPNWFDQDKIKDYSLYSLSMSRHSALTFCLDVLVEPFQRVMIASSLVFTFDAYLPVGDDDSLSLIVYIRDTFDGVTECNLSSIFVRPNVNQSDIVGRAIRSIIQELNRMDVDNLHRAISSRFIPSRSRWTILSLDGIPLSVHVGTVGLVWRFKIFVQDKSLSIRFTDVNGRERRWTSRCEPVLIVPWRFSFLVIHLRSFHRCLCTMSLIVRDSIIIKCTLDNRMLLFPWKFILWLWILRTSSFTDSTVHPFWPVLFDASMGTSRNHRPVDWTLEHRRENSCPSERCRARWLRLTMPRHSWNSDFLWREERCEVWIRFCRQSRWYQITRLCDGIARNSLSSNVQRRRNQPSNDHDDRTGRRRKRKKKEEGRETEW